MARLRELVRRPAGRMKEAHAGGDEGKATYIRKATDKAGGGHASATARANAKNKYSGPNHRTTKNLKGGQGRGDRHR